MTEPTDWREDPAWRLIDYDHEHWGEQQPPTKPPPEAELAQPPAWASLYVGRRMVATWGR